MGSTSLVQDLLFEDMGATRHLISTQNNCSFSCLEKLAAKRQLETSTVLDPFRHSPPHATLTKTHDQSNRNVSKPRERKSLKASPRPKNMTVWICIHLQEIKCRSLVTPYPLTWIDLRHPPIFLGLGVALSNKIWWWYRDGVHCVYPDLPS